MESGFLSQTKDIILYSLDDRSQQTFELLINSLIHDRSFTQYTLRVCTMEETVLGTICGTKVRTCWKTSKPSQTSREEKIAALNNMWNLC